MVSGDVVVVSGQSRAWKVWLDRQREAPESTHHAARRGGGMGQGAWGREAGGGGEACLEGGHGVQAADGGAEEVQPEDERGEDRLDHRQARRTCTTSEHSQYAAAGGVGGGCAAGLAERA